VVGFPGKSGIWWRRFEFREPHGPRWCVTGAPRSRHDAARRRRSPSLASRRSAPSCCRHRFLLGERRNSTATVRFNQTFTQHCGSQSVRHRPRPSQGGTARRVQRTNRERCCKPQDSFAGSVGPHNPLVAGLILALITDLQLTTKAQNIGPVAAGPVQLPTGEGTPALS